MNIFKLELYRNSITLTVSHIQNKIIMSQNISKVELIQNRNKINKKHHTINFYNSFLSINSRTRLISEIKLYSHHTFLFLTLVKYIYKYNLYILTIIEQTKPAKYNNIIKVK